MEISYTLSELDNLYKDAYQFFLTYKDSLNSLNTIIESLPKTWVSDETQSYEHFIELYKVKYQKLLDASQMMEKFCQMIEIKKNELAEASRETIVSFE